MAKNIKYIKLGEKANSFYDPTTGLSLVPGEVKEVPNTFLTTMRARRFLKGGGIYISSKEEFVEFEEKKKMTFKKLAEKKAENEKAKKKKEKEEAKKKEEEKKEEEPGPLKFEDMTKAALIEMIKEKDWEEEDIKKAKEIEASGKKADLIAFIKETDKLYED